MIPSLATQDHLANWARNDEHPSYYEEQSPHFAIVLDDDLRDIAAVLQSDVFPFACDDIAAEAKAWHDEGFDAYAVEDWARTGVFSALDAADLDDDGVVPLGVTA